MQAYYIVQAVCDLLSCVLLACAATCALRARAGDPHS